MRNGQLKAWPLAKQIRFHKRQLERQQFRLTLAMADGDEAKADGIRRQMAIKSFHLRNLREAINV